MKRRAPFWILMLGVLPITPSQGMEVDLATMSCDQYENQLLQGSLPGYTADPIDTVMWLFGYSIAKTGQRVMYGDSLRAFGFALDAECKNNPTSDLLNAVIHVKSKLDNPMDLTRLDCETFEARHQNLRKSDPQSAGTVAMWLFGYAVGLTQSHILDSTSRDNFDQSLAQHCRRLPHDSLFDALHAPNDAVPASSPSSRHMSPSPAQH